MKVLLQRVNNASVTVSDNIIGNIDKGLLLLVGFGKDDTKEQIPAMVEKIVNLRIFPNEEGRFDKSCLDIKASILAVPQFTLYADTNKGRRPEFFKSLNPKEATVLFDLFVEQISDKDVKVETGEFGAYMKVNLENDGPVTIMLDSEE